MVAKRSSQTELDAREFGVGVRCGGWRLGLLVARNVAPAKAGRTSANNRSLENDSSGTKKVSMNQFADLAGVSVSHVKYYYDAWQLAAKAGLVPASETIEFGDDNIAVDIDSIEDEDNPRTFWTWFYSQAKNPPKKTEKKQDSKVSAQSKSQGKTDGSNQTNSFDTQSNSDDIDLPDVSEVEAKEADNDLRRYELAEILEATRVLVGKIESYALPGTVSETKELALLQQIACQAEELFKAASSMKSEELVPQ